MEIIKYLMENIGFPLLVALIILYIEKCIDNNSECMLEKDGSWPYRLFLILMENPKVFDFLGLIQELF